MSNLEKKYILLLSNRLRNFKRKKDNLFYFSCHLCGDSKTRKSATRGTIYERNGRYQFSCFNCGGYRNADDFIKELDQNLFREYIKEKLVQNKGWFEEKKEEPKKIVDLSIFSSLKTISQLEPFHPAVKYLRDRKIPLEYYGLLRYSSEFKKWTNSVLPDSFEEPIRYDEPRIIIPFIDKESVIGFSARSLDPKSPLKYIAITLDESKKRVFGLDRVDINKKHFVVEGPLDSLFLPNCIAAGSTNLTSIANKNSILLYDNEKRNKEVCAIQEKAIEQGYKVVIWPEDIIEKDINEMVLANRNVIDVISKNIYYGLEAKVRHMKWRKN